tara:strand:+ start:1813 stop:2082 length:270 start_codon:yes stop_codon:yes gene_type:complete
MTFIKKYLLLHIEYLNIFYEYLLLIINGLVFTTLFNLRSILKRKEASTLEEVANYHPKQEYKLIKVSQRRFGALFKAIKKHKYIICLKY